MIKNEHIKSIKPLNGHVLLTIYPQSRMKLSQFVFKLEDSDYNGAFYNEKGYLELNNLSAVKKFLEVNAKHLSEELRQSILEEAQNYFNDTNHSSTNNRRLSFFHTHQEKIPLTRLENMKEWFKEYCPRGRVPLVMDAFNDVFAILFPPSQRKKLPNNLLYEVFQSDGKIEIESLKAIIGKAWSEFSQFQIFVSKAMNYPGNNLKRIATNPEILGQGWDILNKEKFMLALQNWLHSILDTKINPVNQQELSLEELEKLQTKVKFIQEAFNQLREEALINTNALTL